MADDDRRYELTTSLSVNAGSVELLHDYTARLEAAIVQTIGDYPAVTAYFARADPEAFEIEVGLRFEGMRPKYIEPTASEIVDRSIAVASEALGSGASPVREESTLVPA